MSVLLDYQRDFAQALLTPRQSLSDRVEPIAIYRNNFFSTLTEALNDVYPVVERLVGGEFFALMARQFIQISPSTSGDIQEYGAEFAQFIEHYPPARDLVYLPDVARLEWLCHQAFHAADCTETATLALLEVPPAQYGSLRFSMHPAFRLLESSYPLAEIWRSNQPDVTEHELIELSGAKEYLIIGRPIFELEVATVPHSAFVALEHIAAGQNLETAVDAAIAIEPDFDLGAFIGQLLTPGVTHACSLMQ